MNLTFNLRVYSCYDFLQSNININDYISFLQSNKITKATLVGTNSLFGMLDFYHLAKKNGIEPVIGLTAKKVIYSEHGYEVTFFAKNFNGYQNLLKISTLIMTSEDIQFLIEQNTNLCQDLIVIVTISQTKLFEKYFLIFKYLYNRKIDVFLGLEDFALNLDFFQKNNLLKKIVAFNKVCYLFEEDFKVYQVLKSIKEQRKIEFWRDEQKYFLSFSKLEEKVVKNIYLIENINKILSKINLIIPNKFSLNLKIFPFPNEFKEGFAYLSFLCKQKLKKLQLSDKNNYQKQLDYELKIIRDKKLVNYFLIVADYVDFAVKKDILVGPGRGSAAGSLVSYLLRITKVDPIKYDLIFERFLNPQRNKMPDIDIDFEDQKREQVLDYLFDKYGKNYVAQIATFQKIGFKMAVRDVGRVLNINLLEVNQISKIIPPGLNNDFDQVLKKVLKLQVYQKKHPKLFQFIKKIIGLPRQNSIHAAGIVIAENALFNSVALWKDSNQKIVLQAEMDDLEVLGLIKMDLLGLKNLTLIASVLEQIGQKGNKNQFLNTIFLNDNKTFMNLQLGETLGVFQLESKGMTDLLKKIVPKSIDDIATTISLYRPGTMGNKDDFLQRKNTGQKVDYLLPDFIPILHKTYGVPIYQEQIIQMVAVFSDLSYGDAEILREAMSKKDPVLIKSVQNSFFQKAQFKKHHPSLIKKVWDLIFKFASYGFNRSHAISYSFIVYWMAYLKTHYFSEFIILLLNDVIKDFPKTIVYLNELKKNNFSLLLPTVNFPSLFYQKKNNTFYLPLTAVKKNRPNLILKLINEYKNNSAFVDIFDFFARMSAVGFDKCIFKKMIYSGALDEFKYNRTTLDFNLEKLILIANFVLVEQDGIKKPNWKLLSQRPKLEMKEENIQNLLAYEIEYFGFVVSYHYLINFRKKQLNKSKNLLSLKELLLQKNPGYYETVILIENIQSIETKNTGKKMAFLKASDESNILEIIVWPNQWNSEKFSIGKIMHVILLMKKKQGFGVDSNLMKKVFSLTQVLLEC